MSASATQGGHNRPSDAALALGARPNQQHEPATRHGDIKLFHTRGRATAKLMSPNEANLYSAHHEPLVSKRSAMARVNEESHTCHPHVFPQVE